MQVLLALVLLLSQHTPELEQLERAWNQAHLRGDAATLDLLWADDLVVSVPDMVEMNKTQALAVWTSGRFRFTQYATTELDYQVGDLTAVVTGRVVRSRDRNGDTLTEDWRFEKRYAKRDGRWRVISWRAFEHPHSMPILERTFTRNWALRIPVTHCTVPDMLLGVSRTLGVPVGVEFIPGDCAYGKESGPRDAANDVMLAGMPLGDILDRLVKEDPRYYWTEADGLIVLRPVKAWADPRHFLHRTVSFGVEDRHLRGAFEALMQAFDGRGSAIMADAPLPTAEGSRRFSVPTADRSLVESLEAIARAHGALLWVVRYCRTEAITRFARLEFLTFDGTGTARTLGEWTRAPDGRLVNPCDEP